MATFALVRRMLFYILRIRKDEGASIEYPVCFCEKEDGLYDEEELGEKKEGRGEGEGDGE